MAIERVKKYLAEFSMADRIREFDVSSATVALAAEALGVEGKRIAKTLAFDLDGQCVLVVCAGDAKVDNKKYKAQFEKKAKMLSFDETEARTGHAVGGVCPFGINDGCKTYLDRSLKRFETVFPACGSSNSAIELSISELEKYAQSFESWVDVCKDWE